MIRGATRVWPGQLLRALLSRPTAPRQPATALRGFFTTTHPSARTKLPYSPLERSTLYFPRAWRALFSRRFHSLRFKSDKTPSSQSHNPTPHLGSPEPAPSLSQRLRKLSREYGWSALGVYLALSALDFPFCFLAVRMLGTERIGHYEHVVIEAFWNVLRIPFPNVGKGKESEEAVTIGEETVQATAREGQLGWSGGVDKAEADNQGAQASIWTQVALAYAIHKSFIFIRVPLTAAVIPKVVKTLRKWGWDIGKRKPKSK
ncbi:hypothetical protein K469DRAFT_688836 [Zopfia rhizophila CBS 207.26]|uniref:DUF1279 domain-containing protein n=1 Tax=Zopfia rhizophila CBS 207.26 TaxID=1314779 RepID=A0A6A6E3A5_9PEZI|nr:hypothetical protein K469DRAFT_688836 [Zopfia rhizophila CBS 207.26]